LIEKGVITETEFGIDLDKAKGEYERKTDQAKRTAYGNRPDRRSARHPAKAKSAPKTRRPSFAGSGAAADEDDQPDIFDDYNVARARKVAADAERSRLTADQMAGKLVSRDEVREKEAAIARVLRDRILGFPARVANLIPLEAMKSLTEECEQLVRELQEAASMIAEG